MTNKWEMCEVSGGFLFFYSPGKPHEKMTNSNYLKSKGSQELASTFALIGYLLDDGWEPYACSGSTYFFRRKHHG